MKTIDELKELYIKGELNSILYSGKNEDECDVVITTNSKGFTIATNQQNGWVRLDIYEYDAENNLWDYSESYDGKWK